MDRLARLSYRDIPTACEAAIKDAIIHDRQQLTQGDLVKAIEERQLFQKKVGTKDRSGISPSPEPI
ncbi:MAG: hypothetical protein MN733_40185 [Nitrososphaera sp.]|nr:hypothetical protein [Nitrososphaera sp.]